MLKNKKIILISSNRSFGSYYLQNKLKENCKDLKIITLKNNDQNTLLKKINYFILFILNNLSLLLTKYAFKYDYPSLKEFYPKKNYDLILNDVNSNETIKFLKNYNPDLIIIFGTKILTNKYYFRNIKVINIHHGFLPYFKGVNSVDWTLLGKNYSYLGFAIHYVSQKLDRGNLIYQERVKPYFFESYNNYKYRLYFKSCDRLLSLLKNNKLSSLIQPKKEYKTFYHKDKKITFGADVKEAFDSTNFKKYLFLNYKPRNSIEANFFEKYNLPSENSFLPGWYILNFHDIIENISFNQKVSKIYTSKENFIKNIKYILQKGFNPISISEGISLIKKKKLLNEKYFSITFDDGFYSFLKVANFLNKNNIKPCLFLCGKNLIKNEVLDNHKDYFEHKKIYEPIEKQYLQIHDVKNLINNDYIEIGSHTFNHIPLSSNNRKYFFSEICFHHNLKKIFSINNNLFAYPFGKLSDLDFYSEHILIKKNFNYFSAFGGINQLDCDGNLLRINMHNENINELKKYLRLQHVR